MDPQLHKNNIPIYKADLPEYMTTYVITKR